MLLQNFEQAVMQHGAILQWRGFLLFRPLRVVLVPCGGKTELYSVKSFLGLCAVFPSRYRNP